MSLASRLARPLQTLWGLAWAGFDALNDALVSFARPFGVHITDPVRRTTVRTRGLGVGEGFLSEPWWCRTLVWSAERAAR